MLHESIVTNFVVRNRRVMDEVFERSVDMITLTFCCWLGGL